MSRERKMIVDAQKLYEKYVNASQRDFRDGRRSSQATSAIYNDDLSSSERTLHRSSASQLVEGGEVSTMRNKDAFDLLPSVVSRTAPDSARRRSKNGRHKRDSKENICVNDSADPEVFVLSHSRVISESEREKSF